MIPESRRALGEEAIPSGNSPSLPTDAEIAQLVEHSHGKGKVTGSSLVLGSEINLLIKLWQKRKNHL